MEKPNKKQYKGIAKRLSKTYNIHDDAQKSELHEAIVKSDYIVEYKDTQYYVYLSRVFAEMYNLNKTNKALKI